MFRQIECLQQNDLSCAFHAIANAKKLLATDGQSVISIDEARVIDQAASIDLYLHTLGRCAGTEEVAKYKSSGGIVLDYLENDTIIPNLHFIQTANRLVRNEISKFSCILKFKTHVIALYFDKDSNNRVKISFADSDSPYLLHHHTERSLHCLVRYMHSNGIKTTGGHRTTETMIPTYYPPMTYMQQQMSVPVYSYGPLVFGSHFQWC